MTGGNAGPVVQPVDGARPIALEKPVIEHRHRARTGLFRRLKTEIDGAAEIACLGQMPGCAEEHRRVPIVPAGMHHAVVLGGVGQAGFLHDRQGVHVGAQHDRVAAGTALAVQDPEHAGAADARLYGI